MNREELAFHPRDERLARVELRVGARRAAAGADLLEDGRTRLDLDRVGGLEQGRRVGRRPGLISVLDGGSQ